MADTVRTLSAILALMPMSEEGISSQDVRDLVVSALGKMYVREVSVSGSITSDDQMVYADGTAGVVTLNLPSAVTNPHMCVTVKRKQSGGSNVVVAAAGAELIDGGASVTLSAQYQKVTVVSDGAGWLVVNST